MLLCNIVRRSPKVHITCCRKYHLSRYLSKGHSYGKHDQEQGVYFGRSGSPFKLPEIKLKGEDFRCLVLPGHTEIKEKETKELKPLEKKSLNRSDMIEVTDDWTKVWPSIETFKWSVAPFPVRMGVVEGIHENEGIKPGKYANAELMKIPNFLHLTPSHIKKHCSALKQFCTNWPSELKDDNDIEKHFPVNVITSEYVRDAHTHRDMRGRKVTLTVKISALKLDYHAKDKLFRLVKHRYDDKTKSLTFSSEKCPLKKQNYDYVCYLLAAVYHESWKTELWESEKAVEDMEKYIWEIMPSGKSVMDTVNQIKQSENPRFDPESLDDLKLAVEQLHNKGEDRNGLNTYKNSVKKLLLNK